MVKTSFNTVSNSNEGEQLFSSSIIDEMISIIMLKPILFNNNQALYSFILTPQNGQCTVSSFSLLLHLGQYVGNL